MVSNVLSIATLLSFNIQYPLDFAVALRNKKIIVIIIMIRPLAIW